MAKCEMEDSWIFLSVARSSGSHLSHFYSAADHINVAIPTNEEIEWSVNRLVACGLVDIENNSFSLTAKGRKLFDAINKKSLYPRLQLEIAVPLLAKAMKITIRESSWHLDPNVAANAIQQYSERTKKIFRSQAKKHQLKNTKPE